MKKEKPYDGFNELGKMTGQQIAYFLVQEKFPELSDLFDLVHTQLDAAHKLEPDETKVEEVRNDLERVRAIFHEHVAKEERLLLPLLAEKKNKPESKNLSETEIGEFIEELSHEQALMREGFRRMDKKTNRFEFPVSASPSHKLAYAQMSDLEQDISQLFFIEKEFLFPRLNFFHTQKPVRS